MILTPEQEQIRDAMRAFAQERLAPFAAEWDRNKTFPAQALTKELERFKGAEIIWCQEEPKNQGGWTFVEPNLEWVLTRIGATHKRARYAGRDASASPATGLASRHKAEQEALVNDALGN